MKTPLIVKLWGQEVGRLNWDFRRKTCYFQFNADFLRSGLNPFPLVAPIQYQTECSTYYGEEERMYKHLPAFIADSLPDMWGSQLLELWRKRQHLSVEEVGPLEMLAFIGKRSMGALEYEPALYQLPPLDKVDVRSLAMLSNKILHEREQLHLQQDESVTLQSLIQVGTSAGGMRPKAVLAINTKTGDITSGQIAGKQDDEYYILKFGDAIRQTAELEMAYYQMATEAGIRMSECRLWEVDGVQHFLTKRFDRVRGEKLHVQTISALMPDANSYEHLMSVCRRLQLPQSAMDEMFCRMVFNMLANNSDDHKKNFSFIMDRSGQWSLSPAYDLTYIFDAGGYTPSRTHCFYLAGKLRDVTIEDVLEFAKDNSIHAPEAVIARVAAAVSHFPEIAQRQGVRQEWINPIWQTLQENLRAWHLLSLPGESPYRLEQTYKGNFHLYVRQPSGLERRYVITPKKPEYQQILSQGMASITDEQITAWLQGWK